MKHPTLFLEKWLHTTKDKSSILCVGMDPQENKLPKGISKHRWCLRMVEQISPFTAAIKINRNMIKDWSASETQEVVKAIHDCDMLAIDDTKLADIGSSNEAGLRAAEWEGFDAVTYAP